MSVKKYCFCDNNCKYETMDKEEILTAITQAVNDGTISNIDAGFVQTIKTINGVALRFFVGSQSEYELLTDEEKQDLFAIITNDTTKEALLEAIETLQTDFNDFKGGIESGTVVAAKAESVDGVQKRVLIWEGEFFPTTSSINNEIISVSVFDNPSAASFERRTFEFVTRGHGIHKVKFFTPLCVVSVENTYINYRAATFYNTDNIAQPYAERYVLEADMGGTLTNTAQTVVIKEIWEIVTM